MSTLLPLLAQLQMACAVCYGDSDSDMARGATAGVAFLGAVILSVLSWIGGMAFYFSRRARRLSADTEDAR